MAGLQLSGLASGFDWKSLVDQLMQVERAPIARIQREQSTNLSRNTALGDLGSKLAALKTAAEALKGDGLFSGRKAASTMAGSTWTAAASAGTAPGSHKFTVTQLASAARREGAGDIAAGLAATSDVSGLTLSTLATGTAPTAGTFSVNGQKVAVALTDSLQDVFTKIASATGGAVTAAYDAGTDKVSLSSASPITLGAANDTSNLLSALKLAHNGTGSVASSSALGALKTTSPLASAGLRTAITAVDGTGAGIFTINGVDIAYNVNTDSLSAVMSRINAAGAGVTAAYDTVHDRVVLTNATTGDVGLSASEPAGGLLGALGVTAGATEVAGRNTLFRVNDGATVLSAPGTTLEASVHGVAGLSVTVDSESTQTVAVSADTAAMRAKIDAFVTAYNAVQTYIDEKSRITTANGKVTAGVLANHREAQAWAGELRSLAFGSIAGLGGTIARLDHLGLDFDRDGKLAVEDDAKLTAALRDKPADVEAFFQTGATGMAAKFESLLDKMVDSVDDQKERISKTNSDLDRQIADIERRLEQQRELLTSSFIAMETAQAQLQQQSSALTNAFLKPSS
ncbi:MAG TPA: flagellar filament capping protein FliD [Opitutaceae bacterium]|nr:flagellar filament capping protein FliD [Opitutaceae bacterium]